MGKSWRLQNPENTWKLLVFARNQSFSISFMPKNVKKLRCEYSIKLNDIRKNQSSKLNELGGKWN